MIVKERNFLAMNQLSVHNVVKKVTDMQEIKSYTDLSQSRKLAEILLIESADMYRVFENNAETRVYFGKTPTAYFVCKPCWSLAALLEVLPNNEHVETTLSKGGWKIEPPEYINTWWCEYEDNESLTEFNVSAENPIDACYEMILKLKENNLL